MKEELTDNGFQELLTSAEVNEQLTKPGTTLVMVNSVCGCSAGSARPGVLMAVANGKKKPDFLATSFAGSIWRQSERSGSICCLIRRQFPVNRVVQGWQAGAYDRAVPDRGSSGAADRP